MGPTATFAPNNWGEGEHNPARGPVVDCTQVNKCILGENDNGICRSRIAGEQQDIYCHFLKLNNALQQLLLPRAG